MSYFNYYLKRKRLHSMGGYCVFRLRCGDTLSTALSYITYRNTWHVILQMGSCCVLSTVTCTSTSANTRPFEFSLVFFFLPILPCFCLKVGSCGSCRPVDVSWWVGSERPGWLGARGCHRAASSPGRPAWPPAELRTTAARSERRAGLKEWTVRRKEEERGYGKGRKEKDDMNKWILKSTHTKKGRRQLKSSRRGGH